MARDFFGYKRMATINPAKFKPDMELFNWEISEHRKVIRGKVLYDLSLTYVKGESLREEILSILYQHGHVLIKTKKHDIICWSGT